MTKSTGRHRASVCNLAARVSTILGGTLAILFLVWMAAPIEGSTSDVLLVAQAPQSQERNATASVERPPKDIPVAAPLHGIGASVSTSSSENASLSGRAIFQFSNLPASGARVWIESAVGGAVENTFTDEAGKFTFSALAGERTYTLRVEGHALAKRCEINLRAQEQGGVDLVLVAEGRVSGHVLFGDTGEPAREMKVAVGDGAAVSTDSQGFYQLRGIPVGNWDIRCAVPPGAAVSDVHFPRGGGGQVESIEIALGAGSVQCDFLLERSSGIEGIVLGPAGTPLENAKVSVAEWFRPALASSHGHVNIPANMGATSDSSGRYRIDGVPPGAECTVVAVGEGCAPVSRRVLVAHPIEAAQADFVLSRPGNFEGRVVDKHRRALGNVIVTLDVAGDIPETGTLEASPQRPAFAGVTSSTTSDAEGIFSLSGLAPGSYQFSVSRTDAKSQAIFRTLSGEQRLEAGGKTSRFELVVEASEGPGSIVGTVRDAGLQPVAAITVEAWSSSEGTLLAEARTDAMGLFRLDGLPSGSVTLRARKGALAAATLEAIAVGTVDVNLTLAVSGSVAGVVYDASTGQRLAEAEIVVLDAGPLDVAMDTARGRTLLSDAKGEFYAADIPQGRFALVCAARGYAPSTIQEITVQPGRDNPALKFSLDRAGRLEGYLSLDGYPAPLTGTVEAWPEAGGSSVAVPMGQGQYLFDSLSPGTYRVRAQISRNGVVLESPIQTGVEVVAGETVTAELSLY